MASVQSQGWGLIPIWSGLQAPCACKGSGTTCKPFPHIFASDPATAFSQGAQQADLAFDSVTNLGLDGSIIYVDIEQYDSAACGSAVQAYVNGWVTEMHEDAGSGSAGVYGAPADAATDFSVASPIPDDVWIARYDQKVTVWNLGHGLADTVWANFQRIKQFDQNLQQNWGGQSLTIDPDIEDATIYAPGGSKTYSTLTPQLVTYPGSPITYLNGINNGVNNISTNGFQMNEAVGYAYSPETGLANGLIVNSSGVQSTFSYPASTETIPEGINNLNAVVGYYEAAGKQFEYGFRYNAGTFSPVSYGPAKEGEAVYGINDAGWIVGTWFDSLGYPHCFLKKPGTTTISFDAPAVPGTYCLGINGFGQIVGWF